MMLDWVRADDYANKELASALHRIHKLTDGSDELYKQNEATLMKLLQKILRISRREEEWFLYFYALSVIMNLSVKCDNYPAVVKYAEVFYKDSDLYMNRELFYHKGNDAGWIGTFIYANIFVAYKEYHQIDDDKMNMFMKKYEEAALIYGGVWRYYDAEMDLGLLYWDIDLAEHGKRYFEQYEHEIKSCYFCSHGRYKRCYLMKNQLDLAEKYMLMAIQNQAPKPYWSCGEHNVSHQYGVMLWDCLMMGRPEAFRYFYEKYWLKQPEETRKELTSKHTQDAYCGAIDGYFAPLEKVLQLVKEDVQNASKYPTVACMLDSLEWWCYFRLLDRSGIHEVTIELTGVSSNRNGKTSCLALSNFFEQRADDYGMKFEQAREKFDYQKRKDIFRECAGLQ